MAAEMKLTVRFLSAFATCTSHHQDSWSWQPISVSSSWACAVNSALGYGIRWTPHISAEIFWWRPLMVPFLDVTNMICLALLSWVVIWAIHRWLQTSSLVVCVKSRQSDVAILSVDERGNIYAEDIVASVWPLVERRSRRRFWSRASPLVCVWFNLLCELFVRCSIYFFQPGRSHHGRDEGGSCHYAQLGAYQRKGGCGPPSPRK